jgi:hypothetical protein
MCTYKTYHTEYTLSVAWKISASSTRSTASASLSKCGTLHLTITSNKSASLHRKWRQILYTRSITTPKFLTENFLSSLFGNAVGNELWTLQVHNNDTSKLVTTMPITKTEIYVIHTRFKCIASNDTDEGERTDEHFMSVLVDYRNTRWCSWLRHCATSREVVISIPDGIMGVFHLHKPSGCTTALGWTQPPRYKGPVRRADNLAIFHVPAVWKFWELQPPTALTACPRP